MMTPTSTLRTGNEPRANNPDHACRRTLAVAIGVQAFGSLAIFASIAMIGWVLGPVAQGAFSKTKAEIEFIAALVLCGIPQAMTFYAVREKMRPQDATGMISAVTLTAACAALILETAIRRESWYGAVAIGAATAAFVCHGLLRALVLAHAHQIAFAVTTSAPQVALFLFALVAIAIGQIEPVGSAVTIFAAYALGVAIAERLMVTPASHHGARPHAPRTTAWLGLVRYGAISGLSTVLNALAAVIALWLVESRVGAAALGQFAMALVVVQIVVTPINLAAPLLFRNGLSQAVPALQLSHCGAVAAGSLGMVALGVAVISTSSPGAEKWTYGTLLEGWKPIALTAAAESILKYVAPTVLAAGQPQRLLAAEMVRLVVFGAGGMLFGLASLHSFLTLWCIGCVCAAAALIAASAIATRRPQ